MFNNRRVVALIKLAGKGTRIDSVVPKQYVVVKGCPVYIYTLLAFQKSIFVDEIIVSVAKEYFETIQSECSTYKITKLIGITIGGATGNDSTFNCSNIIRGEMNDNDIVISHDGVRALVSSEIIDNVVRSVDATGVSTAACKPTGCILLKDGTIIDRSQVYELQTPTAILFNIFKNVRSYFLDLDAEEKNKFPGVDSILFQLNYQITPSDSTFINFKITTNEDLELFKIIKQLEK